MFKNKCPTVLQLVPNVQCSPGHKFIFTSTGEVHVSIDYFLFNNCWFSSDVINFSNCNLLGLLNFYGHRVKEIVKIYRFTSFQLHDILCVWNVACWIFKNFNMRDIAMVLWQSYHPWKRGLLLRFLQLKQFKYWERCLCVYVLARKETAIAFIAEVSTRCFLWFLAAMMVPMQMGTSSILSSKNLREMFWQITQQRYVVQTWGLKMLFIKLSFITFVIINFFH